MPAIGARNRLKIAAAIVMLTACRREPGFSVSIDSPADGATVQGPVRVRMSAKGFQIERAGLVRDGAGHFHVLIDAACDGPGQVVPASPQRVRLEDGRNEVDVPLRTGDHTLCVQASDGRHTALAATDRVTVHVVESAAGVRPPSTTTTTSAPAEEEQWQVETYTDFKAGPDCEAGRNDGLGLLFRGRTENEFEGGGTTWASAYSCRTPQGSTTIPAQARGHDLTGRKEPTLFILTFSNGPVTMKIPIKNGYGVGHLDQSVGDYRARSTVWIWCQQGC